MRDRATNGLLAALGDGRDAALHEVPGRIEVLGKHTDYAGGRSLLCAVDRGFRFASAPRDDRFVRLEDDSTGQVMEIDPPGTAGAPGPSWRRYPEVVIRRARVDFGVRLRGCDIDFSSDLPSAAGLSSSSALIVGVFLALDHWSGLLGSPVGRSAIRSVEDLADYLAAVEAGRPFPGLGDGPRTGTPVERGARARARGVGTRGGSQDHVAILCSARGTLVRYAFRPARLEGTVPLPDGLVFAVAASGVRARKTGPARAPYNRLSDLAREVAALWRRETGGGATDLAGVAREAADGPAAVGALLEREGGRRAAALAARWRHFVVESEETVPAAFEALRSGDLDRFGVLVDRSQARAGRLLGNQVPETEALARTAREEGAVAASAFGAGFGGSVWALVDRAGADAFVDRWRRRYHGDFPARAVESTVFVTTAADPARPLPERLADG